MKKTLKILLSLLLIISSIIIIVLMNSINILSSGKLLIINIIVIVLCLLFLLMLFFKKINKVIRIIFIILTLLVSFGYIFVSYTLYKTIDFTKNITDVNYENVSYKVLTLNTSSINDINDLKNKNIGFLTKDNNIDKSVSELKKSIKFKKVVYDEIGTLIGNLYEGNVDAIVLNNSYMDFLDETNIEFLNENKEIYEYNLKVLNVIKKETERLTESPFIVYISGSDSRGSVYDVARSDVNIVVVVNPNSKKMLLISIPRDYYVQLHDTYGTKDKLTHAGVYGIDMSITTIEDLLEIDINHYMKTSFDTVVNLVDTIDGVDVYSDTSFNASGCTYNEGMNHLDGKGALRYSRERKIYDSGDRHRGENQQAVITAIVDRLMNPKYLIRYNRILDNINGTIVTDISYDEITDLVKTEMDELDKWEVESISLDGYGSSEPTYSMGSRLLYVMIPYEETVNNAKNKIQEYLK